MDYLLDIAAIVAGFVLLIWGAERFINGAAAIARHLGVSPLLIGLTIVGLGTSAPEILVSVMASWQGNTGMAIGNAIGSNIANIGLILGFTALVTPLSVHSRILRREYPIMLGVSLLAAALMMDLHLSRLDGLVLLGAFGLVLALLARFALQDRAGSDILAVEFAEEIGDNGGMGKASGLFIIGLVGLLLGSRLLVWGAVNIATAMGVSDLVIGLTIVAIGTSLPELAASVTSALKGEHEIAIGNVIGSNIFNLLTVLPVPGLIAPGGFDAEAFSRDVPVMLALTIAVLIFGYHRSDRGDINRWEGFLLLCCFAGYQLLLYFSVAGVG
ncbi:MAG: calcium/sodium antiporter [Gammaproteobacteria bacterium]|nr:calcium/sodium antiporter [Gammaproteobacteria bacterium]